MSPLPKPSAEALQQSNALTALIRAAIENSGNWIPFSAYMRLALYSPGLGYYSGGAAKFGSDFYTAPEISPLFGQALAHHAAEVLAAAPGDILELGAGSGKLARDILLELEKLDSLPGHYFILEVSADLRQRQQQALSERPDLLQRVRWLDSLPALFEGLIVANEVLDALPVEIVRVEENAFFQRGVAWVDGKFAWEDRPLGEGKLLDEAIRLDLPAGYVSEINLEAEALVCTLSEMLKKGELLLIDYGFGSKEYYHSQRSGGTLMCHYRQHVHDDPFFLPGLQDITAHVDFSAVAENGIDSGLAFSGYTTQAHFLINCGILQLLAQTSPEDTVRYLQQSAAMQKLLSPAEMGELFKVISFTREMNETSEAFATGDRSRSL